MFIQTEETHNPLELRFIPGVPVLGSGTMTFNRDSDISKAPIVKKLFEIEDIDKVVLGDTCITLLKKKDLDWQLLKPAVLAVIMNHFVSEEPIILEDESSTSLNEEKISETDKELVNQIAELLETRIRPVARDQGGDIIFHDYKEGQVVLEFKGGAYALQGGVQTMLRHYIPEVEEVINHLDAIPKPGLSTPEGKAIKRVIDEEVNPQIAMHGGHIALVDVIDDTAYVRLEGGCQGCGMASVTLKQGVEGAIMQVAPSITQVLDTTDHAGGDNPYFQPGKEGMSAF